MSGRKVWAADDVLTAADLNDYLMDQAVMVFTDSTARGGAILTPTEGMLTYLTATNQFQQYNGTAWVGLNSEYTAGVKIFTGAGTPTADANATVNLWFN
jgi:hypothetical protein